VFSLEGLFLAMNTVEPEQVVLRVRCGRFFGVSSRLAEKVVE